MFDTLTERLTQSLRNVTGSGQLTEDNIKDTLREVRMALLEADVALPVTREFIAKVKEEALGQEVMTQLSPGQAFVKIVYDELTKMMGEANETLDLSAKPPVVVLLAGLQGAGKTTTAAKLARFLKERQKKKVMTVSADVYRPAAIKQLETVSNEVGVGFIPSQASEKPIDIVNRAIEQAKIQFADVLIVDTAGRLHVDEDMMDEIKELHACSIARLTISIGFSDACDGIKPTPTSFDTVSNCLIAAGRYTSAETVITFFFWRSLRKRANFAAVVVLPAPCKPARRTTTGGFALKSRVSFASPIILVSSS
jgi:signal recognition particle GTPase